MAENTALQAADFGASGSPSSAPAGHLIISEYVEGSSNNKAIEIYNGTGRDIDLTGYTILQGLFERRRDDQPHGLGEGRRRLRARPERC